MKKTIIKYICDCCKSELENETDLIELSVPSKHFDCEGRSYSKGISRIEVCKDCYEYYWNLCMDKFAAVDDGYNTVVTKRFNDCYVTTSTKNI